MVRIKGVVKTAKRVKSQLQHGINPHEVDSFKAFVLNSLHTIEKICTEANRTPDSLTIRSRKAYAWMKFLTDKDNLQLHIQTTQKVKTLANRAIKAQQSDISEIQVTITNYNGLYEYNQKEGAKKIELDSIYLFMLAWGVPQTPKPVISQA